MPTQGDERQRLLADVAKMVQRGQGRQDVARTLKVSLWEARQLITQARVLLESVPSVRFDATDPQFRSILLRQLNRPRTVKTLAGKLNVSVEEIEAALTDLEERGYIVKRVGNTVQLGKTVQTGGRRIHFPHHFHGKPMQFGVVSDMHMGNKHSRLDVLEAAYDEFARRGIKTVFCPGNYVDGEARFNTHELVVHGFTDQALFAIDNWPQRRGITTYYVDGDDHEGWYYQREGVEFGRYLQLEAQARGRNDLQYLGYLEADIVLRATRGDCTIKVMHPGGGSAYAISYSAQKLVESLAGHSLPAILLCFHPDTPISMADYSTKPISKVRPGDHVLSEGGAVSEVLFTRAEPYEGRLLNLVPYGVPKGTAWCKPDHLLYRKTRAGEEGYVEASRINKGDWLLTPRPISMSRPVTLSTLQYLRKYFYRIEGDRISIRQGASLPAAIEVDEGFAYLLGAYTAEGHIDGNYRVRFALNQKEAAYTARIIQQVQQLDPDVEPTVYDVDGTLKRVLGFSSVALADLLSTLMPGTAPTKRVPACIINSPAHVQLAFMSGLFEGDGCLSDHYYRLTTVSRQLCHQVFFLAVMQGFSCGISCQTRRTRVNWKPVYTVRVKRDSTVQESRGDWFSNAVNDRSVVSRDFCVATLIGVWRKVRRVDSTEYAGPVCDLAVDGTNSYVAGMCLAHNCGHFHKFDYCVPRGVHAIQCGCLTDQSTFLRKKKIEAHVGFVVCTFQQDINGGIVRLAPEWFPFRERTYYQRRDDLQARMTARKPSRGARK